MEKLYLLVNILSQINTHFLLVQKPRIAAMVPTPISIKGSGVLMSICASFQGSKLIEKWPGFYLSVTPTNDALTNRSCGALGADALFCPTAQPLCVFVRHGGKND